MKTRKHQIDDRCVVMRNEKEEQMYQAAENRYLEMKYNRCGKSGLLLPQISLGLWQNFGLENPLDQQKEIITCAFAHVR